MRGRKAIPWYDQKVIPLRSSTIKDIYWLAGFYEGEGHCRCVSNSIAVIISQKQLEPLTHCREVFGGMIGSYPHPSSGTIHQWRVNGIRATGILYTIFSILSKEKREQIINATALAEFNSRLSADDVSVETLKKLIQGN